MNVDPEASMRCWELTIDLNGREFTIPAVPAVSWWPVLGDPQELLELVAEQEELDDLLISGETLNFSEAIKDAIEAATGRSTYVCLVLHTVAVTGWAMIGGELARAGFDWTTQPIGAALDLIHTTIMAGMTEENRKKFQAVLDQDQPKEIRRAAAEDDFASIAGPKPTTGVRATGAPSGNARPRIQQRPRQRPQGDRSPGPTRPPAQPARSDPAASSGGPQDAV